MKLFKQILFTLLCIGAVCVLVSCEFSYPWDKNSQDSMTDAPTTESKEEETTKKYLSVTYPSETEPEEVPTGEQTQPTPDVPDLPETDFPTEEMGTLELEETPEAGYGEFYPAR